MVSVSASVDLPLHHKVQKFSSGTGWPGWSWKQGCETTVVIWCWLLVCRWWRWGSVRLNGPGFVGSWVYGWRSWWSSVSEGT